MAKCFFCDCDTDRVAIMPAGDVDGDLLAVPACGECDDTMALTLTTVDEAALAGAVV